MHFASIYLKYPSRHCYSLFSGVTRSGKKVKNRFNNQKQVPSCIVSGSCWLGSNTLFFN